MIEYITGLLLLFTLALLYKLILRPMKLKSYYSNLFKKHGYKVYELPYKFYTSPFYDEWATDSVRHKDSFYKHRHIYCNYDVIVTNSLRNPEVIMLNPDLIKDLVSP